MKKAVMYGAGNIGRGFIGQLFYESGFQTSFIDVNLDIIHKMNADGGYPIKLVSNQGTQDIAVTNICGVNGMDLDAVAAAISEADVMATAVGVNILPRIVSPLVAGFRKRWQDENFVPLNIIICENMIDANRYLENMVKERLTEEERKTFDQTIGLVEASIGRMVPAVSPEMQNGNILTACAEPFKELPVDLDAIKGEMPQIVGMIPSTPFEYHIQKKLFLHNLGHAATAYLGYLKGYTYIYEAIGDCDIFSIVKKAMTESARALSAEHGISLSEIESSRDNLLERFTNVMLKDTIERVGKDPIRKLSPNDRLIGAVHLCEKHGLEAKNILIAAAAGFLFNPEADESAHKVSNCAREKGISSAVEEFCKLKEGDGALKQIERYYNELLSNKSLAEI
jgi:mannitol-1-phosphate 5-dehydrogenase